MGGSHGATAVYFFIGFLTVRPLTIQGHFEDFKLPPDYNKRDLPAEHKGHFTSPLEVSLKVLIAGITHVDEFENEVNMDLFITRSWQEERLILNKRLESNHKYLLDHNDAIKFWIPDIYITGMRYMSTKRGLLDLSYFMIRGDKSIYQVLRVNLVIKCHFHLEKYPMDRQQCKLDFMSALNPMEELRMSWMKNGDEDPPASFKDGAKTREEIVLPNYRVTIFSCPRSFVSEQLWGNSSAVRLYLILDRELKAHLLETYLPTGLFVVMSWGSFLVRPDIVPGRMVLLVTNLLSLVTLFEATRTSSPPVLGVTSLDVWLLWCVMFVFFALVEYAVILSRVRGNFCKRRVSDRLKLFVMPPQTNLRKYARCQTARRLKMKLHFLYQSLCRPEEDSSWNCLDRTSVLLFPALFLVFNITYWSVSLGLSRMDVSGRTCRD